MDDAELVEQFRRTGDEAPFRALVERHRQPVFRLILSILGAGREGAAEELTQDVFVKVFRRLGQFRGEARFGSWLYRIAYNQAVDHRSRARFKMPHYGEEVLAMTPSDKPGDDPLESAARASSAAAVRDCLAELPHLYRSVLHLHYWLGMTVAEIGAALSAPEGTVKSYLYRGRARLHRLLAERGIVDV